MVRVVKLTKDQPSFEIRVDGAVVPKVEITVAAVRTYDKQSRVFLFYSFYKFNQLLSGDWRFREVRPQGHYRKSVDVITLHTDPDGRQDLPDTLVHEASHQLVEQRIFGEGNPASLWVAEGLASYFGYTYLDAKGAFHPGEIGGKRVSLVKGERAAPGREASARLKEFRRGTKAFRAENGSPFTWIVSIDDPGTLYGQGAQFHYAASWLLVR